MNTALHTNAFWNFSLEIWRNTQNQTLLISLQNDYKLDLCCVLFAIWCSKQSFDLSSHEHAIKNIREQWNTRFVLKIRALRRQTDQTSQNDNEAILREKLLETELLAEQLQHEALFQLSRLCQAVDLNSEALFARNLASASGQTLDSKILNRLRILLA